MMSRLKLAKSTVEEGTLAIGEGNCLVYGYYVLKELVELWADIIGYCVQSDDLLPL